MKKDHSKNITSVGMFFFLLTPLLIASTTSSLVFTRSGIISTSVQQAYAVSLSATHTPSPSPSPSSAPTVSGSHPSLSSSITPTTRTTTRTTTTTPTGPTSTSPSPPSSTISGPSSTTTSRSPHTTTAAASTVTAKPTQAPRAIPTSATTTKNTPVTITLTGSGSTNPLTFFISSNPSFGTLGSISSTGSFSASVTYTPRINFAGIDSFYFRVMDSVTSKTSSVAQVRVTVVNRALSASSLAVTTSLNTAVNIQLQAADPDPGDRIIYVILPNVQKGTLTNFNSASGAVTYTPRSGYTGSDSFNYLAIDSSQARSNVAKISISITRAPSDSTPPVVTASPPGGTYNAAQSVTLTSNEKPSTIYYTIDGSTPTTTAGTRYTAPITLDNQGSTPLRFFGVDAAGNQETVQTQTYTIDTTAPAAPYITSPTHGQVFNAASAPDGRITITVSGTTEPGSSVRVFDMSSSTPAIGTTTANATDSFTLTTTPLSNGIHRLTATATDAAGNTSPLSQVLTIKVALTCESCIATYLTQTQVNMIKNYLNVHFSNNGIVCSASELCEIFPCVSQSVFRGALTAVGISPDTQNDLITCLLNAGVVFH
jgi:hypothetical protein